MKKKLFAFLSAAALALLPLKAANLVPDSGFDGDKFDASHYVNNVGGAIKVTRITEDMTWNKCLKMETVKFREYPGGKALNAELIFGKTNGKPGFAVEPDTVYNFSFDFKGNHQVSLYVYLDSVKDLKDWKRGGQRIRPSLKAAVPDPKKWGTVKGSFKTAPNTRWARLALMFWADSKRQRNFKDKIGDFVLIDNVKIEKRRSLDAAPAAAAAVEVPRKAANPINSTIKDNFAVVPSPWLKGTPDVPFQMTLQDKGDHLVCKLVYDDPDNAKSKYASKPKPVRENGSAVWRDDVAELLFSLDENNKEYIHYAVSISGGRYRSVSDNADLQLDKWQLTTSRKNGKSEYTVKIPYSLLGYKKAPAKGSLLKFNAGIKHNGIYYGLKTLKTNFRNVSEFMLLGFGSVKDYQKSTAAELRKNAPESMLKKVNEFAAKSFATLEDAVHSAEILSREIVSARMGTAPFILAKLPLNGNFSAPLEVGLENVVQAPIELQAAGKETAVVPLVIVNRTKKTASYRVMIHDDAKNFYLHENHTLQGGFPAENITLREGIAVKDSDGKNPGTIFDALPKINEAYVVTAAPGEAALVWVEINTAGVKPGKYAGSFRIIPLSEPAEHTYNSYKGEVRDYPINLEILPFELPPPISGWLCSHAGTLDQLKYMLQIGGGRVHITPFLVKHKFNLKGDLIDDNGSTERLVKELQDTLEMYRKANAMHVKPKFLFGYGTYLSFTRTSLPKNIKPLTPEWENCWRNHLKGIRQAIIKSGVGLDEMVFEVFDEPKGELFPIALRCTQILREVMPESKLMMTWALQRWNFHPGLMKHFDELLDEQTYHWGLRNDPEYKPQIKKMLARKNTSVGLYQCSTSIREDLHTYYRLHPWRSFRMNCNYLGFYTFSSMTWGKSGATDWKRIAGGAIVYRSVNSCIPSIRYMALRRGVDDIRYMTLLKKYAGKPDVDKLLKTAAKRVEDGSFNASVPDTIRAEAIKLILKYQR